MVNNHGDRFRPLRIGQGGTPSIHGLLWPINGGDPNYVSKSWDDPPSNLKPSTNFDPWGIYP